MAKSNKHYINVRDWPEAVSPAEKARIEANVNEKSHPGAVLYWWLFEDGTPDGCAQWCDNVVAGALVRGKVAFEKASAAKPAPTPAKE